MTRNLLLLLCSVLLTLQFSLGQQWFEMIQNPEANFFEVQKAAEAYFEKMGTGKGSGWKQYKRWEYMQSLRINADGTALSATDMLSEMQRYQNQHPVNKRSSNQGNWRELGPGTLPGNGTGQPNGLGRINCITFHPTDPNIMYAGAPSGGIWQTLNKGQNWFKISAGLTRLGVSSIVVHPTNPNIIYIGTGDRDAGNAPGYGVWRSTDGGGTWQQHNTNVGNRTINKLLMHPTNPDIIIAAGYGRIYRTVNGGTSWTMSYNGHDCKDMVFHPTNPNIVYASGSILLKSTDNGQSFQQVTSGLPQTNTVRMALGVSPAQPDWVYILNAQNGTSGFGGLYKSTNSGDSFTTQSTSPNILGYDNNGGYGNQGWYDLCIAVDPVDANVVYTGGINIWQSVDGGQSWSPKTHWWGSGGLPAVHADDHYLIFSPYNTNELWLGNDGGIYITSNAGNSWASISNGLAVAQVYKIGQSATDRDLVINGYQDNGTAILRNEVWTTEIGGDGMECAIDYSDPTVMYGSLYYGDIRRSIDGGGSFVTIASNGLNGINEGGGWVTPYKLHPTDPNTMFIGYRNVWRSTNVKANPSSTVSWSKISNWGTSYNVTDLSISLADSAVAMVSMSGGSNRAYITENLLATTPAWTTLVLPASGTPRDIEFHPTQRNTIWISLGNDIYRTDNLGLSWSQISGTLPNIPIKTIVADAKSNIGAIYIGMDVGVYYKDDNQLDWIPFSMGLPPVEVTELEIFYDDDCGDAVLRAATYGRGLWESDLRDPGTEAPMTCFEASPAAICEGASVSFKDLSSFGPTSWQWEINPGDDIVYLNGTSSTSHSPQIQFNRAGIYAITLITSNARGADTLLKEDHIVVGSGALAVPYVMDFENANLCGTSSDCGNTVCSLDGGWFNATNGEADALDWRVHAGATPSSSTGPIQDANTGLLTGKYVYLEGSGGCSYQSAIMTSPCLDLRLVGNPAFSFNLHMYGARMGNLHVDLYHNGNWTNNIIPATIGNQGNLWITKNVDLSPYAGNVIRLRFRGVTGAGYETDMAIDNIQLTGVSLATEVVNFEGSYIAGQGNQLRWDADNITPGEQFFVQRKNPETDLFEDLSQQEVTAATSYAWLDPKPIMGPNYYRLAVFTVDGTWDYFETIEVVAEPDLLGVMVFPNPFNNELTIRLTANDYEPVPAEVRDMQGKLIFAKEILPSGRTSDHKISLDALVPGMYLVIVRGRGYRVVKK